MPSLRIRDPAGKEWSVALEAEAVSFGRSCDCDLVLDSDSVSRRHGRLLRTPEGNWWVEDLKSKNGVYVNGQRVDRCCVRSGDLLEVGCFTVEFDSAEAGRFGRRSEASLNVTLTERQQFPASTMDCEPHAVLSMDARRLTTIYEISRQILAKRDLSGLLDAVFSSMTAAFGAQTVVFGLTCDPEREPEKMHVRFEPARECRVALSRSIVRRTLDSRQALLLADVDSDAALRERQSIVEGGIRSALCVPLMRETEVTGFMYIDSRRKGRCYSQHDLEFASAVGAMLGTAIENLRLHEAEVAKQRIEAELASARQVQQAILPGTWPAVQGWDICGHHSSSREVGGDYCDAVVSSQGHIWLVVADVAGKGVPAALVASCVHSAVHVLIDRCASPAELLAQLNTLLLRRPIEMSFVTASVVRVDAKSGEILASSAGHPHPIMCRSGGPPALLPLPSGLMLGVSDEIVYADADCSLCDPGSALVLYSDGLTEAMNTDLEQFGEDRVIETLSACDRGSAPAIVSALQKAVVAFRGRQAQSDDLTLLVCQRGK